MRRHSCLYANYVIGQDQNNRRKGTPPNQGREPPLVWSVEFFKKVHVASNDTAPLVFPLVARAMPPITPAPTLAPPKTPPPRQHPSRYTPPCPCSRSWLRAPDRDVHGR